MAQTFTVGTDYATLQDAISAAQNALTDGADTFTIKFATAGTYAMAEAAIIDSTKFGADDVLIIDGDVDGNGTKDVILDGGNTFTDGVSDDIGNQILKVISAKANVTLQNLTFQNGYCNGGSGEGGGGAVYVKDGSLTVSDSTFQNNTVSNGNNSFGGGAVAVFGSGSLTVKDNTVFDNNDCVSANTSGGRGGAVWLKTSGTISIDDATFTNNSAKQEGGAIATRDACDLTVSNSTFEDNSANSGGAIMFGYNYLSNDMAITFDGTNTFKDNTATTSGGAIFLTAGKSAAGVDMNVLDSATMTFTGNSAKDGGAIHLARSGQIVSDGKMIFNKNSATNNGGAIFFASNGTTASTTTIFNADFVGNTAGNSGGAVIVYSSTVRDVEFVETLFSGNTAVKNGGAIFGDAALVLDKCTIIENSSGLYYSKTDLLLSNSVIGWNTSYDVTTTQDSGTLTNNLIGSVTNLTVPEDQLLGDAALDTVYEKSTSDTGIPVYSAYSKGSGVYIGDDGKMYAIGATPDKIMINVDAVPPEIAEISGNKDGWSTENITLTVTASDDETAVENLQYAVTESNTAPAADAEKIWQTQNTFTYSEDGARVRYFWVKDETGNISAAYPAQTVKIDKTAPVLSEKTFENVAKQDVIIRWNEATDGNGSGVAGYRFRFGTDAALTGDGESANTRSAVFSRLNDGTYYYQIGAVDAVGNIAWSGVKDFVIAMNPSLSADAAIVSGTGGSDGVAWQTKTDEAASYIVEYSTDNFASVIRIETDSAGLATLNLPGGDWQWRVQYAGSDEWITGEQEIKVNPADDSAAKKYAAVQDGKQDVFFVRSSGAWQNGFQARHVGSKNSGWNGTNETAHIMGQNRFGDIFSGCEDANILYLTDDANGDVLFVDDVFTASFEDIGKTQARLANIDEIRAGAGNDIVDMTSQKFDYTGDGLIIRGGDGDDTVWANSGDNFLFGDAGNDRIIGANGNDVMAGGTGNDRMHGGGGNDIFTFGGGNWGNDIIEQLDGGSVTLWFENGIEESDLTIAQDGENTRISAEYGSITVLNTASGSITLKFGSDDAGRFAELADLGAFSGSSTDKIFENSAAIAAL